MASKILLLEDDLRLSEIIEEFLNDEGYEVFLCNNSQEALYMSYERYFDLWILDVKVPLRDGF